MNRLLPIFLWLAVSPEAVKAEMHTVEIAKAVASKRFFGFKYGSDMQKKQINCVQFISEVVSCLVGRPLAETEIDAIYIKTNFDDLNQSVDAGDEKTKGVVYAFTKILKCGREISHEEAKSGDFIQYWIKKKNGDWMGHSAIIAKVWKGADGVNRAAIYGAHQSTNGIAETAFKGNEGLRLSGADRRVYIARFELPQSVNCTAAE
jgi:hypothetical protein